MVVKGSNEWKKLNREMKILQAKRKAGGLLPKEASRLEYLEERFGEANQVKRIRLNEEQDDGSPKKLTSDDHWATEVSEDLLDDAENFEAVKAWDKDIEKDEAKFAAADSRKGKDTFAQDGLSPFAVDLTTDFKDEGFQDDPVEEEESAEKTASFGRVNYATMDDEEPEPSQGGANPFAVSLDAGLAGALGNFDDGSVVPDGSDKSFEADMGDEFEDEPADFTARVDESPGQAQQIFQESDADDSSTGSIGELTTHEAGQGAEEEELGYDLMRAAMDYAEEHDLEDETSTWGTDEQGQEVEYDEPDNLEVGAATTMDPSPFADDDDDDEPATMVGEPSFEIPTWNAPAEEAPAEEPSLEIPSWEAPAEEAQDEEPSLEIPTWEAPAEESAPAAADDDEDDPTTVGEPSLEIPAWEAPAAESEPATASDAGVLIPDPPDEEDPTELSQSEFGVLVPDAPDKEDPTMAGQDNAGVLIPDAPEVTAEATRAEEHPLYSEPEPTVTEEGDGGLFEAEADAVPDMSDGEDIPDMSDGEDIPDLSDGEDIPDLASFADEDDSDSAPKGQGYKPPPVPEDDLAYTPEAMPGVNQDPFAAEIDLSEASMTDGQPFPDVEIDTEMGESADDELDEFWGLDGATTAESAPEPPPPPPPPPAPTIASKPAPLPAPGQLPGLAPAAPETTKPASSRPLPALNLDAARVTQPQAKPPQPAPSAGTSKPRNTDGLLSNLFGEEPDNSPKAVPETMEPIIIGPAKRPKPKAQGGRQKARAPMVGRGVSRQAATHANDLSGPRKATIHFKDGVNRRGVISKINHHSNTVVLEPPPGGGGKAEKFNTLALKAIFLMLPKGVAYPHKDGYPCKVMMIDGRVLEGTTNDYDPQAKSFTLFPAQDRGNIERIVVFNEAIKNIWFPEE